MSFAFSKYSRDDVEVASLIYFSIAIRHIDSGVSVKSSKLAFEHFVAGSCRPHPPLHTPFIILTFDSMGPFFFREHQFLEFWSQLLIPILPYSSAGS